MADLVRARGVAPRVGLIGVGPISDWHVRALRVAGLEVAGVASRRESTRVRDFATRHSISRTFEDWEAMLAAGEGWDGLVIATHTDGTADVLAEALRLRIPLLVEKPVAWTSARLEKLAGAADVIVAFNRRFYRTAQAARDEARGGPPVMAQLSLPESIEIARAGGPGRPYWEPFFSNSCHGFDLLRFVLGPLHVEHVTRHARGGAVHGLAAVLTTERGDVIDVLCNWAVPTNFALAIDRPGRRLELRPFELATVYEGMDVVEPTEETPIRRYLPRLKERITLEKIDATEKPGFVQQATALRDLIERGVMSPIAATMDDALATLRLCEELLGEGIR